MTPVLAEVTVHRGINRQCLHIALTVHVVSNHHGRVIVKQIQVISLDTPGDCAQFCLVLDQYFAANAHQILSFADCIFQYNLTCNRHVLGKNLLQLLVQRGCVFLATQEKDNAIYRAWFNR